MIEVVITAVGTVVAAASLYLQSDAPERRRRRVCRSLLELKRSLMDIAHTGVEIGDVLQEGGLEREAAGPRLERLLHLLEVQNQNLARATTQFQTLEDVLEVKAPELARLRFHLYGKNERIDILYDTARSEELAARLREEAPDYGVSELVEGSAEALRETLAKAVEANPGYPIEVAQNLRQQDKDFQAIVRAIEPLAEVLDHHCAAEDLV